MTYLSRMVFTSENFQKQLRGIRGLQGLRGIP